MPWLDFREPVSAWSHCAGLMLALPGAGGPDYLDITVPERPVAGRNPQPSG